jgi:drug/metabolite transporter (DMT)-like permease
MNPTTALLTATGRDYALLLLLALLWSSSFLLIKIGVETVPPLTLSFSRMLLGALLLCSLVLVSGDGLPKTKKLWAVAGFVGLIGNALPFTLIHWGEKTIDSGLTALLMGVMPIWVVVLAHIFTNEKITVYRSLGIVSAFGGLIILVGWDVLKELGSEAPAQLAVILAAICYAVTTIFVRRQQQIPMRPVAAGSLIVGAAALLPLMLLESPDPSTFSSKSIFAIVLLGILQTGVAALIYFYLLSRLGATIFSQINYLIPILGVGWGILLLGEQPGWQEATALLGILGGLVLVNHRTPRSP